jgi:RNA polymerase sigma factor (sigma-70 family)
MMQANPTDAPTPDGVLIDAILGGEKTQFELIIRRYNQRLYRVGMSILHNDADTEDAMQSTYINAYEHLGAFKRNASLGTWITRIMINECLVQKNKKQSREKNMLQTNSIIMTTPAHQMINKELNGILENAIERLPGKYRLVFVLRELEELSVKETSEVLHIEQANVKVRLNRAKSMLKSSLNDYIRGNVYPFHLLRCNSMVEKVMHRLTS